MISEKMAKYISGLNYRTIPSSARQDCKKMILDTIGVAVRGSKTKHGRIAANFAREIGEKKESTVIGYGYRSSPLNACFANGVMAHGIDFDDTYSPGSVHVGCAVIPAALAIGEVKKVSGRDLITAVVAGYDISCRVASAIFPPRRARSGFHITGVVNCFGAVAAAGKILNLKRSDMMNAFGIAGDQASGLVQYHFDGNMIKHFHGGKAAQNGLLAALLAKKGFTGSPAIFEDKWGFCNVLFPDDHDLTELTKDLGKDFRVSNTSIKPYPSCGTTHTSIEAALDLKRRYNFKEEEIDKIILRLYAWAFESHNKPSPKNTLQALLSQQYCIANALVRGSVKLDDFAPKSLKDAKVVTLMKKIELIEDGELTKIFKEKRSRPIELQIFLKSGERFTQRAEYALGSPMNPMSESKLINKFNGLVSEVLERKKREELLDSIMKLEDIRDVRILGEYLF